jgi:hypothetical protein
MEDTFGKCRENPVLLRSIADSILFMDALISALGSFIVYHRKGSSKFGGSKLLDCYEVMTTSNEYDTFYINSYNPTNVLIPPKGYLFDTLSVLYSKSRRDKNYSIEEEYLMMDDLDWDEEDLNEDEMETSPTLLSSVFSSFGYNFHEKNFPSSVIKKHLENEGILDENQIEKIIGEIIPRPIL